MHAPPAEPTHAKQSRRAAQLHPVAVARPPELLTARTSDDAGPRDQDPPLHGRIWQIAVRAPRPKGGFIAQLELAAGQLEPHTPSVAHRVRVELPRLRPRMLHVAAAVRSVPLDARRREARSPELEPGEIDDDDGPVVRHDVSVQLPEPESHRDHLPARRHARGASTPAASTSRM